MERSKSECLDTKLAMSSEETALVIAAQAGDDLAFETLYKRYAPRISAAIARVLINPHDREDALQDCFFKAYRRLGTFEFRSLFSTWLTRIAINSALIIMRKLRARREEQAYAVLDPNDGVANLDFVDQSMDPEERYIEIDLQQRLQLAVVELPPRVRAAVQLRNSREASVGDISRALNVSVAAVKSRLHRGRILLQKRITETSSIAYR